MFDIMRNAGGARVASESSVKAFVAWRNAVW